MYKLEPIEAQPPAGERPADGSYPRCAGFWQPSASLASYALTCDVEDYFQVSAFEQVSPRSSWTDRDCRIPRNVDRILELYDSAGAQGTFFTLGWVAENHPEVVRRIARSGHEIASHGMQHVRAWNQSEAEFGEDVGKAKKLLEDVSGQAVRGYRAASWSFSEQTPWSHDVLAAAGYEYSSSVYPISHDHYGLPDAPRRPFYVAGSNLLEIPASAVPLLGRNLPAGGGGYFRLLPYSVSRWLIRRYANSVGTPPVFYYHPWELDPDQPRMTGIPFRSRFRHYVNLERFEDRLTQLLSDHSWGRMDRIFLGS